MVKHADLSANERAFILEAIGKGVRLDGRSPDQLRPLDLTFGEEFGHVNVRLGKTRYISLSTLTCCITMETFADIIFLVL